MLCNAAMDDFWRLMAQIYSLSFLWAALAGGLAISDIANAQNKPERLRIGYAARAVARSAPSTSASRL
jgi:hypothetical protein